MSAAWFKKDLASLTGMLDGYYVEHRPLDPSRAPVTWTAELRAFIAKNRKEIVLGGIRSARSTGSMRYSQNCETIGNQLVRFTEYGQPDELIERFTKLAREEDAGMKRMETLLHRVLAEGLPPEVEAYDPVPADRGTR